MKKGCYPFFQEPEFETRMRQVINTTVEVDIPKYARMTIAATQKYDTVESPVSDFEIDGKTFEVGGRNKGKKQISNLKDAYVVKDTIEYVFDNQVPLWMFGFLY